MNRMNAIWNDDHPDSVLDQAIASVTTEPIDEEAARRVAEKAMALDSSNETTTPAAAIFLPASTRIDAVSDRKNHLRWRNLVGTIAAIAALLLIVISINGSSQKSAFAQVVEQMKSISSVRFVSTFQFANDRPQSSTMLVLNDILRCEQGGMVQIFDTTNKKYLVLDKNRKTADLQDYSPSVPKVVNPIAELLAVKDKPAKSLGRETINGQRADVFRLEKLGLTGITGEGEMTVWFDSKSSLPLKIEVLDLDPKHKTKFVFEKFEWNAKMGAELFSLSLPSEYKWDESARPRIAIANPKAPATPTSQDLSNGLLYSGRVPSRIEVDQVKKHLTAILKDDEKSRKFQLRELQQWDLVTGKVRWTEKAGGASELAICPALNMLCVVHDQEIQLRDLATGKVTNAWETQHPLGCVAINRNGTKLAHGYTIWGDSSETTEGGIEIWDIPSKSLERTIEGTGRVDCVAFSPVADIVVMAGVAVKLFDANSGKLEHSFLGRARAAFSNDGTQLAFVSAENAGDLNVSRVDIAAMQTYAIVQSLKTKIGNSKSSLLSLSFSANDQHLAAGDWNGTITVWDFATGSATSSPSPAKGGVHSVRFTDTSTLASGSEDGVLRLESTSK